MLDKLTRQLAAANHLTDEEVRLAVGQLVDEAVPALTKADFLTHLARKGETTGEIAAFARELRGRAVEAVIDAETRGGVILDVVGTGGDRLSTFNISTTVAILAAAAGVRVAKHGNRASTSPIGSADVMEALGIPFDLGPEETVRSLREHGFAFFFAPKYHRCCRTDAGQQKKKKKTDSFSNRYLDTSYVGTFRYTFFNQDNIFRMPIFKMRR